MSDVKKIATRESYGNTLVELAKEHDDIFVLDADLAGATKTDIFKKAFPDRHIDCGIAEANMMGIAAGMAATGKVPFASSFAMFAAGRAFEQIRNSIGIRKFNQFKYSRYCICCIEVVIHCFFKFSTKCSHFCQ